MLQTLEASAAQHRVLIVDDDPQLRRMWDLAFSLAGFDRTEAHNGHQALDKAVTTPFAVAVVDLWLPGLDGFALIQRLKSDPRTAAIPVLAITGHHAPDLRDRAQRAGADALLLKPVTPEALTSTALLLVERAALLRDVAARRRSSAPPAGRDRRRTETHPSRRIAPPSHVRCRFCGSEHTSVLRETEHTFVFSCSQCDKQWRRAKE
jgi:two-component system, cell cycle response regulator DivK